MLLRLIKHRKVSVFNLLFCLVYFLLLMDQKVVVINFVKLLSNFHNRAFHQLDLQVKIAYLQKYFVMKQLTSSAN